MPYYAGHKEDEKNKVYYKPKTEGEHLVIRYTGLNLIQIDDMDMDEYLFYLREAFIHYMNQTEEGRKYLKECYISTQTEPDRKALRAKFGRKGGRKHGK